MSLHTYKISMKSSNDDNSLTTHSITDTSITFSTVLSKNTHINAKGYGRIEFLNENLVYDEVEDLQALYSFMESAISNFTIDEDDQILIQFEEFNTDTNTFVILMPFTPLENVSFSFTNSRLNVNATRMQVTCELVSSALRSSYEDDHENE